MLSPAYFSTLPRWACDDGGAASERIVHHGADRLRGRGAGQRGGADHVEEQDGDLLEGLGRFGGASGGQRRELGAQAGNGRIDDGITEQRALRLERLDRGLELLLLGRHRRQDIPCSVHQVERRLDGLCSPVR